MDRIDLYADVEEVEHAKLLGPSEENGDATIIRSVARARERQAKRYDSRTKLNADMTNNDIKTISHITTEAQQILNQAAKALDLSARSYMRIIKVARTIADLDDSDNVTAEHTAEALQYRGQNLQSIV